MADIDFGSSCDAKKRMMGVKKSAIQLFSQNFIVGYTI